MRVVISGGGTGGHIYPALAIYRGLRERFNEAEFLFVGSRKGLEAKVVPEEGLAFEGVPAAGLERRLSARSVVAVAKLASGVIQARSILRRFRPQLVIGTGGYSCFPVVFAAARMGIATMIHEQNAFPGLANRMLARSADIVCITFGDARGFFRPSVRIEETGLPIRPAILATSREVGAGFLGLAGEKKSVLVVGGSQGAESINRAMIPVIARLAEQEINVIHVTGQQGYERVINQLKSRDIDLERNSCLKVVPYLRQMETALAVADLVVGRAGASFLAEITAKGIPAILIPYPYATDNHQMYNAKSLVRNGAAVVLEDKDLNGEVLYQEVRSLLDNQGKRQNMALRSKGMGRPGALEAIVELASSLLGNNV